MRLAIGIDISKGGLKESVEELCDVYDLTLDPELPVIKFPNDSKAIFFADLGKDKLMNVDAIEADAQVGGVWLEPVFLTELKEDASEKSPDSLIKNLNRLFKNS